MTFNGRKAYELQRFLTGRAPIGDLAEHSMARSDERFLAQSFVEARFGLDGRSYQDRTVISGPRSDPSGRGMPR